MVRVFKPAAEATVHTPAVDETFADIVKTKCDVEDPPITEEEVALFNWGTKEPKEVVRALVELVGVKTANDEPGKCVLDPARGPAGGKILLPKLWKKDALSFEKNYTLKVKKWKPATAIAITKLDKWFLPADENCDVGYVLEGIHDRALKVDMEVYASNYTKATATNDGEFVNYAYADIPDTPILKKSLSADAAERSAATESSWKGESEAAEGVLKPRDKAKRYINVASSPYTVSLRYYKDDAHKKAILRMDSFWPRWSGTGGGRALVDDSLKFKWTLKDCPGAMQGQFLIFDKDDKVIWQQALTPAECGNGEHTHDWTEGKPLISEANIPYRVQIQVHSPKEEDKGFGLAGMHTEVRILAHPEIGTHGVDHEQEPQVLPFAIAPFYSGPTPPEDSAKGRKMRLANAGYHPGPIEDGEAQLPYLQAVKEFQRDHAVEGGILSKPVRLKADGSITQDTKTLIAKEDANRRPLFAGEDRADIKDPNGLNTNLNDKAFKMIAWVDDRTNYTQMSGDSKAEAYLLPNMGLENYHGSIDSGDAKADQDKDSICRPWLPIEVDIPLMKKGDSLQTANPAVPTITDSMRNAVGPIRVDWTFRDLEPEYKVNTADYNHNRVRSLRFLTKAIDDAKGTHNGKDAFNCPKRLGGLREGDYYKAPLGNDTESLMPWKAEADSGVSAVCSVTHDDLGQDADRVYAKRTGKAGMYLHPSIIGGDGYQFRVQVSFRDLPSGATHPNWKVLRDRYESSTLPQAHTAKMRLWRKDSFRGHISWMGGAGHWGAYEVECNKYYEPAMVHIGYERTTNNSFTPTAMYGFFSSGDYRKLIAEFVVGGMGDDPKTMNYHAASEMSLSNATLWPWAASKHLGVHSVPAPGTKTAAYERVHLDTILNQTWHKFRQPLSYDFLSKLESAQGLLRGHFLVEFKSSAQYWAEKYICDTCNKAQILIETEATGGSGQKEICRSPTCATGVLHSSVTENYTCNQCRFHMAGVSITRKIGGSACTSKCTGTMRQSSQEQAGWFTRKFGDSASVNTTYTCDICGRTRSVTETPGSKGSGANVVCGEVCPRKGVMTTDPGSARPQDIYGPFLDLALPSFGGSLGILFLDTLEPARTFWTHEVGHHKQLEHAGDVIAVAAQHDRADNLVDVAVQADVDRKSRMWDRACIMSYANTEAGDDRSYFCGKCLLKLRGWKVEGLPNPAGNLAGP